MRRVLATIAAGVIVSIAAVAAHSASGQKYPYKPIRIVTGEPGSANDFVVRLMSPSLAVSLGQPVIVDNRGAIISQDVVSRASSDGYTLLVAGTTFWIGPLLQVTSYDPMRDFLPITLATTSPSVLVVHPSIPARSVSDLIAYAKTKPGELNYGSGPSGSTNHLAAELFKAIADVNIVRVPYKGTGPAGTALVAGEVHLMFVNVAAIAPHLKVGRLRALAVGSARPSALLPDLPTIAASLPGFESSATQGLFAPARTPASIIDRLNKEMVRLLHTSQLKNRLFETGVEVAATSPGEAVAVISSEIKRFSEVISRAGIRAE